ncbi:PC-esterase domain-containing protein 1A [Ahaetulla prasina]|uniref:PC-esterase domain-containing protein 1A n=1 Tax=Ahaetulla prasina TaxID=499056 RepID=UPI00264731EB|nr:PC-esterase domain-containing protein 1A [Ahaetulla prasina]
MLRLNSMEVRQLLHNKFVVILGDSIQRSVYKDLIQLLQSDSLLTSSQMKSKGEFSFENDLLIEGGMLDGLHNGIRYREVRQYRTHYHLIRFYFLTRIYSEYFESILDDFRAGPQPDVLILNSCVWDVSRYGSSSIMEYRKNLEIAFNKLDAELSSSCLVIWNMTMPLGPRIKGGFLIPELQHLSRTLRQDIIEGNFYGATLAALHLFDVVDLHFHFRFDVGNRFKDGIHWNNVVHRRITNLLLTHLADAWGVVIPEKNPWGEQKKAIGLLPAPKDIIGHAKSCRRDNEDTQHGFLERPRSTTGQLYKERQDTFADRYKDARCYPEGPSFYDDCLLVPNQQGGSPISFSGFTSFEESRDLSFCPEDLFREQKKAIGLLPAPKDIIGQGKSCRRDNEDTHHSFLERPRSTTGQLYKERQVTFADRYEDARCYPEGPSFYDDCLLVPNQQGGSPIFFSGFTSFEESRDLSFCPKDLFRDVALDNFHCHPWGPSEPFLPYPSHNQEHIFPRSRWHRQGTYAGAPFVMRQEPSYRRDALPYRKRKVAFNHY